MERLLTYEPPEGLNALRLQARRGANRWLPWALAFTTCALALNALIGDRGLAATLRARDDHARAQAALARLKNDNARLMDQVERFRSDPRTIEDLARAELGLVRKGEVLVLIKDVVNR